MEYFIGIDIGGGLVKAACRGKDEWHLFECIPLENSSVSELVQKMKNMILSKLHADDEQCHFYFTGIVPNEMKDTSFSEMSCLISGALSLNYANYDGILQIGNTQTIYIKLKNGKPVRTQRNDSCASGSGKYLNIIADVLGVSFEELNRMAETASDSSVQLSSTCAVFAESEAISLLHAGIEPNAVAYSAIMSLAERVCPLITFEKNSNSVLLCGGVAESHVFTECVQKLSGCSVIVADHPIYISAMGASIMGEAHRLKEGIR